MKKLLVLTAILSVFSFSSCKKECTCTTTTDIRGVKNTTTTTVEHDGKCSELNSEIATIKTVCK